MDDGKGSVLPVSELFQKKAQIMLSKRRDAINRISSLYSQVQLSKPNGQIKRQALIVEGIALIFIV